MKTCLTLALALCCVMALSVAGCEDMSRTAATTAASATATTVGPETTTTGAGETTTTAAPATTTTASAKPGTASTTKTTAAPAAPAATDKLLKGTWTWDVDANVDGAGAGADLQNSAVSEVEMYLEPLNGAGLARIAGKPFNAVGLSDLLAAAYSTDRLATEGVDDPNVLMPGDVIALLTDNGQYAKLQIVAFEPEILSDGTTLNRYNVRLRYVLYLN